MNIKNRIVELSFEVYKLNAELFNLKRREEVLEKTILMINSKIEELVEVETKDKGED